MHMHWQFFSLYWLTCSWLGKCPARKNFDCIGIFETAAHIWSHQTFGLWWVKHLQVSSLSICICMIVFNIVCLIFRTFSRQVSGWLLFCCDGNNVYFLLTQCLTLLIFLEQHYNIFLGHLRKWEEFLERLTGQQSSSDWLYGRNLSCELLAIFLFPKNLVISAVVCLNQILQHSLWVILFERQLD